LESHRDLYVLRGRRALVERLLCVGEATADDVRAAVELPDGVNPKCFGAVPGPLAKAGIIERVGFAPTSRPMAHARNLTVWRLVDSAAAEAWLQDHPDQPDPEPDRAAPPAADRQGLLFPILENDPTPTGAAAGAGCAWGPFADGSPCRS